MILNNFIYKFKRAMSRKPSSIFKSNVDSKAKIGNGAQIYNSSIGKYTYVYESKVIHASIGKFCSIASDCIIGGGAHPIDWVSSSPLFLKGKNVFHKNFSQHEFNEYKITSIGNDVWIGSRCLIKGGVTIGDGVIIGMGSVVTHDIPPYEIWAGNPARFIKKRFDDETIKFLLHIQWWNFSENELKLYAEKFNKIDDFIEMLGEK